MTPLEAIRKKCLQCSNYQPKEVELCPIIDCPLYLFRFGKSKKIEKRKEGGESVIKQG
jgi:hypothetical protein